MAENTDKVKIEVDSQQAEALLELAYREAERAVDTLHKALSDITHYEAADGRFSDARKRFNRCHERACDALFKLDELGEDLFPLFAGYDYPDEEGGAE